MQSIVSGLVFSFVKIQTLSLYLVHTQIRVVYKSADVPTPANSTIDLRLGFSNRKEKSDMPMLKYVYIFPA